MVVKVWSIPNLQLYILGPSEVAQESESAHSSFNLFCGGPVKWFISAMLIYRDLAFAEGIPGSKKKWR